MFTAWTGVIALRNNNVSSKVSVSDVSAGMEQD